MTCREAERLVTPYIQDKLSGMSWKRFWSIWNICRNCQEELEIYFMVDVGLKQLDTGSGTLISWAHCRSGLLSHMPACAGCGASGKWSMRSIRWA
mgnify:CR=1 FL=1